MKPSPKTISEVIELSRATKRHFDLFENEVAVYLDDFTARIRAAENGNELSGNKLLRYLRSCLMSRTLPDPLVSDWAARCMFEITHHGIDPNKAFSLKPETGRPQNGGNDLRGLLTWEDVEKIRIENGFNKIDAIAAYQEKRNSLARLIESEGDNGTREEISTLEKQYRRGAALVKRYLEETGK